MRGLFSVNEVDHIYQLFSSNWEEDKTIDRHFNSKSGYGKPICTRCESHWWSHWVYLRHTKLYIPLEKQ